MSDTSHSYTRLVTILVITCVVAAFTAQPAAAQTAKKLNCNGCVKSKQLKNNGIRSKDIKNGQVRNADLGNNAVTSGKVANGGLTAVDLGDEAGVEFAADKTGGALAGPAEVVQTVTINAPRAGVVIVNASGYFTFATAGTVRCNITTDTIAGGNGFFNSTMDISQRDAWGSTRAFEVAAGAFTVNLVCEESGAQASVFFPHLNAIYVPTRY